MMMEYDWDHRPTGYIRPTPVLFPRWTLTAKYFMFIITGILGFLAGVPTLDLTTFYGYAPIWCAGISIAGLISFIGSLKPHWWWLEAIGSVPLTGFIAVLVVGVCIRGSYAVGMLLLMTLVVPLTRAVVLTMYYKYKRAGLLDG